MNTARIAWRCIRCSTVFACMQHVGNDGSLEGEHEVVGGFSGEQVTPRSRLMVCERIDVRQSGASQTETIDEVDRFKTQRKPATVRKRTVEARG
ncbi:hypothetical protein WQE_33766 [Paraburkholderia hospita]|uniref:Uncharacterized protein n=2 Tax=Paraburkholderia hospita TaxID=169430 RepID=A0ABN0FCL1_9BURK|nr:hypothetical protein WQE_33766 [Paraburkholderia hospita]